MSFETISVCVTALLPLVGRFLGVEAAQRLFEGYALRVGARHIEQIPADARLVHFVANTDDMQAALGEAPA